MGAKFRIRIVYVPQSIPEAEDIAIDMPNRIDEETVEVEADTLGTAVKRAMLYSTTPARGRLVRYYDEQGRELFSF